MRICLAYDCLYPYTVGGAERWYRALAERLAEAGHEVSYLTLRQWPRGEHPQIPGVRVIAVGPRMKLYTRGRRRIAPPVVFGAGVLLHLLRFGRRYDVVHTASFPYFSVLAAAGMRRLHGFRLFVDWFEIWTREYWLEYIGRLGGSIGARVQRRCARTRHHAFCFSRLHQRRLLAEGFSGSLTVLRGLYAGEPDPHAPRPSQLVVVSAGRQIPEKRITAIPPAIAAARPRLPQLRCEIYGDGPDRSTTLRLIADLGLEGVVRAPGVVEAARVDDALACALCLLVPSRREGYGLVVVEAAVHGTPSVLVAGDDNAAAELIRDGENGVLAASAEPGDLADAVIRVHAAGEKLRASTAEWFDRNRRELSIDGSVGAVLEAYSHP
jgi:glycosyltransferase involved in cell wall biosynthesis